MSEHFTIAIASGKGGTGKTTTAAILMEALENTVGIDLDTQGALVSICGGDKNYSPNIVNVLNGESSIQAAVQHVPTGLDVVGNDPILAKMDLSPVKLQKALEPLKNNYKNLVLDTSPVITDLTVAALSISDLLIVPIRGDGLSLDAASDLCKLALDIKDNLNPNLVIGGFLLTHFNPRIILRRSIQEAAHRMASLIGTRVFRTTIRDSCVVSEAQVMFQSLLKTFPNSNISKDYQAWIDEMREIFNV